MFDFLDKIGLKAVLEQIKAKFPSSLPANGGNADYATNSGNAETVDNVHVSCVNDAIPNVNWFAAFTNENNLRAIDPARAYVGNAGNAITANTVKTMSVIGTGSPATHNSVLDWANSIDGFGTACIIDAYGYPSDLPVQQEGLITVETDYQKSRKIVTFTSYVDIGLVYQRSIWSHEWRYDWYQTKAGNADKLDGLHAEKFMRYEPDKNLLTSINDMITPGTYGVYSDTPDFPTGYGAWGLLEVQAFGSIRYQMIRFDTGTIINRAKTVNQTEWTKWKRSCDGGNADTLDDLHADDFVNANDRGQTQIPNNVDVPMWIHTNGKRFHRYMTNVANIGLTNVPNNSTDYVWYWYDGLNIMARVWSSGRYYICDTINGAFSGWKDVYTSGYKPYVTGVVSAKYGEKANVSFGFTPSMVLYQPASPKSNIPGSIYVATMGVDANGFTPNQSTYNQEDSCGFAFIAFK